MTGSDRVTTDLPADRPLREWPLEQLAEQATLHASDASALAALMQEVRHRRGAPAKALEARIARMIADGTAAAAAPVDPTVRLRATLAAAGREIAVLRARLAALDPAGVASDRDAAYRRLYLTPDAPAWLLTEIRRAYRRRYHPDTAADQQQRRRSEEVFKRAEADFAAIEKLRGS